MNAVSVKKWHRTYPRLLAARMPKMFPMKSRNRMLTTRSRVIAFPGTLNRFSLDSCLIVIPEREMP
jgi:hypothetical protein